MCYKDEKQKQLYERLVKDFEKLQVPEFIQRYFVLLKSSISKINYWITIRSMLEYMIEKKSINRKNIAEIQPEDFLNIDIVDITSYLEYLEKGMSSRSVYIKKNMLSSFWNYLSLTNRCPVKNNIIKSVPYDFVTSNNNLVLKMPSEEQLLLMETRIKQKPDPCIRERNLTVFMILKGTGIRESELAGFYYKFFHHFQGKIIFPMLRSTYKICSLNALIHHKEYYIFLLRILILFFFSLLLLIFSFLYFLLFSQPNIFGSCHTLRRFRLDILSIQNT